MLCNLLLRVAGQPQCVGSVLLGCAVALESLKLFDEEPLLERANAIGERIGRGLEPLRGKVSDLRGLGSIRAVELPDPEGGYLAEVGLRLRAMALERGSRLSWLRAKAAGNS